jgi:hypothetical protein
MRVLIAGMVTLTLAMQAWAEASSLPGGEYITERGFGHMLISHPTAGKQVFSINAVGGNQHMCSLEGVIDHGFATAQAAGGETCVIKIARKGAAIEVGPVAVEACRSFCGMRAGFGGLYQRAPAVCSTTEVHRTRDVFIKQYWRKQFAQARDTLEPVLSRCGSLLYFTEEGDIRNDLAITLYHLGEYDACRRLLEPLRKHAEVQDVERFLMHSGEPETASMQMNIAGKTATNLRLCRSPSKTLMPPVALPKPPVK